MSSSTDTRPAPTIKEQMEHIDTEIAWHHTQIALLKAKRNSLAPICQLPTELLSRIFAIYAVDSGSLFNLKWTQVMEVCWHWHHVSLAAHSLWSFIDLAWCRRRARLYGQLERSGVVPLTLKIGYCDSPYHIDVIMKQSERIRVLEVAGEARYIHGLLTDLPNCNFPILTSLRLDPNMKRDEIPAGSVAVLPETILNGGIPNLCELTLSHISLPWMSVRGLESLSLTNSNDSGSPSIQDFNLLFAMLEACPQLRTLRLENVCPPEPDFDLHRTVHLPALSFIHLRDHVLLCRTLLVHLDFPTSARLHIYPFGVRVGADIRGILVPICRRLRIRDSPHPALLMIECNGDTAAAAPSYCMMSAYMDVNPPDLLDHHTPHLMLNSHPTNETSLRQILSKVVHALSFQHITHLDLRLATYLSPVSWRTALTLLPSLDTVYIHANLGAIHFLRAVIEVERFDPERRKYQRIRRLHVLVIAPVRDTSEDHIPATVALLQAYLQVCHALGTPLPVLEIDERHHCLARYDDQLEAMFLLIGEQMIRNGEVYDPVKREAEWNKGRAERRLRQARLGIELEDSD
ncbi:hypothetical protein DFH09DRAFT_1223059 [Mycena vulgaris]|nr:hypothetical protein DFH09DRAFT_1223059 [Mycena vulgaris]